MNATCTSCGRTTSNTRGRWAPVIVKGETTGYTCPACPRHGEPIRRIENGAGVRFRVTLDAGVTVSGKRKQETKVLHTLAAAREHVLTRSAELAKAREAVVLDRADTTFAALAARWLVDKRPKVRPGTHETYAHAIKPVVRHLGEVRVQKLTYDDIERLARWLVTSGGKNGQPLGVHAAKASLGACKQVLDHAVRRERLVSENVARGVTPPRRIEEGVPVTLERWTAAQLLRFTTTADTDAHAAAWRLVALGFRREEVLGLRWADIDLDGGLVHVRQTRVKVSSRTDPRGWTLGPPKSKASRRTIRPDEVQPGTMALLRKAYMAATDKGGLVVVDAAGQPVMPDTFSDRFTAICHEAGVPTIKVHSTRHSVAYLLHVEGVPPVKAAAFLGHRLDVHLSTYLFARESDVDTAATSLGAALARVAEGA